MKVILLGELRGKGGEGDIVEVAQGYAENFLFPQRIAQPATPGNIKQLEERRHVIAKREEKRIADANAAKEQLDGKNVKIEAKVGENNQLFGSVTPAQIADAICHKFEEAGIRCWYAPRNIRPGDGSMKSIHEIKTGHLHQMAEWRAKKYLEPELRQLFLELTLRCNERCLHCGSSCGGPEPCV